MLTCGARFRIASYIWLISLGMLVPVGAALAAAVVFGLSMFFGAPSGSGGTETFVLLFGTIAGAGAWAVARITRASVAERSANHLSSGPPTAACAVTFVVLVPYLDALPAPWFLWAFAPLASAAIGTYLPWPTSESAVGVVAGVAVGATILLHQ